MKKPLVENQKYTLTLDNSKRVNAIYCGTTQGIIYKCDLCGNDRSNCHEFVIGDINNPESSLHYGSECIKKLSINRKS